MEIIISPDSLTNTNEIKNNDNKTRIFDKLPKNITLPISSNLMTKEFYTSTINNILLKLPSYTIRYADPVKQKLFLRKHFYKENTDMKFVWDAFCNDSDPNIRKQIYSYAVLYIEGGIIMNPEISLQESLYTILHEGNINNDCCLIFPLNGYINPDFIASTKQHLIVKSFLKETCMNILHNRNSLPIKKQVHTRFDTIAGKYMLRYVVCGIIQKPNMFIPDSGLELNNNILLILNNHIYDTIFQKNHQYYKSIKMTQHVHMDYNIDEES